MIRKILYLCPLILVAFACADNREEITDKSALVIKTGTICGWCAQNDTLSISGNMVRYVNYTNCSSNNPSVAKTGQIESSELDDLLGKLDVSELKKLDMNSCNVCFDGCDDWISYSNGTDSHYIRFTRNDPKLQQIQAFVDQLFAIKAQCAISK
jgi:hypothetical protein